MSQRILVFERNTAFLQELESGFGKYGAEVEVASDVEHAFAQAKAGRVDAVFVSVDAMSAPGEAFLVCKRFKSDDQLAAIPFVIMGGASHAESLASHKKLKRKADEYIELPVAFERLLTLVRPLLPWLPEAMDGADGQHGFDDANFEGVDAGLEVDADIDAFADHAFNDLVIGEDAVVTKSVPPGPSLPPPALGSRVPPSADRATERELQRLKAELEESRAAAQAAEERALAAERRAKAAEAHRPSVPPPSTGVSSRDYLDLREQLNRKEKELLGLRDEVTSRDRKLLDASDRTLQLERTQAELGDTLAGTQRQLEETVAKVAGYEVDLEAAKKRREELNARLQRSEENLRRLERELDDARAAHTAELSQRTQAHEQQVRGLEEQAAADAARLRADHAAAMERLASHHASAVADLEAKLRAERDSERAAHENASAALRERHANDLRDATRQREEALEEARAAAEAALQAALAQAAEERASALNAAAVEHAALLAQRLDEADQAKDMALAELRAELEAKRAAEVGEQAERHNKELAVLGRKLSEADATSANLAQRLSALDASKAELEQQLLARIAQIEANLATRTEERDLTHNELSAARVRIHALEEVETTQGEQIATLQAQLASAQQQIARQNSKIAGDEEILERVRKALGISIGLLEQQKQNAA